MSATKSPAVVSLKAARETKRRKDYADLVMQAWDRMEADDRRADHEELVERKIEAHFAAKNRF